MAILDVREDRISGSKYEPAIEFEASPLPMVPMIFVKR